MSLSIYHNPRCSKSRQALALLHERGEEPRVILYLQTPPTVAELDALSRAMKLEPLEFMRTGEKRFKELGLSTSDQRARKEWLRLMADNPVLIERPIVSRGEMAVLGRPPESVLSLL